jgi:hypothetical protein
MGTPLQDKNVKLHIRDVNLPVWNISVERRNVRILLLIVYMMLKIHNHIISYEIENKKKYFFTYSLFKLFLRLSEYDLS